MAPISSVVVPDGVHRADERVIRLTPPAGEQVRALREREGKGDFLRVAVRGGGCNGLSYQLKFVPEPKKGDLLIETEGTAVIIDPKSVLYLKGTTLDFSDDLVGGGLTFVNPRAKGSCSCGESFNL